VRVFAAKLTLILCLFLFAVLARAGTIEDPAAFGRHLLNSDLDTLKEYAFEKRTYELTCQKNIGGLLDVENLASQSYNKKIEIIGQRINEIATYYMDSSCKKPHRVHIRGGYLYDTKLSEPTEFDKNKKIIFTNFFLVKEGDLTSEVQNLLLVERVDLKNEFQLPTNVLAVGSQFNPVSYYAAIPMKMIRTENAKLNLNASGLFLVYKGRNYNLRID
jgi:hypothetical protein